MPRHASDLVARIAWSYYIQKQNQAEIAANLNLSRQSIQRYLSQALEQGIVVTRIDHRYLRGCMELGQEVQSHYRLRLCEVAPATAEQGSEEVFQSLCALGAQIMERFIRKEEPCTFALGSGQTIRHSIDHLEEFRRADHNVTSLVGFTTPEGNPSEFDLVTPFAEKTGAQGYYFPAPLVLPSLAEKQLLEQLTVYQRVAEVVKQANVAFASVSPLHNNSAFLKEGLMTADEWQHLQKHGACAELLGRVMGADGRLLNEEFTSRLAGEVLRPNPDRLFVCISGGNQKHQALHAILQGQWINGLVTDEQTAHYLLQMAATSVR
jgi:DNA-binding transcriptional regulator LsrR (DeoR family)